jgi:hypothetical protein
MTTSNMTSCAQPMQITFETANQTPIAVCFNHTVHGTKHFVHYGAVKGSARTRHELDMPCSRPVYESTLRHLARERHSTYPIVAEIFPMEDGERVTDVADVHEYEILEALTLPHKGSTLFWENIIHSCGLHDTNRNTVCSIPMILEDTYRQLKDGELLEDKQYRVKKLSEHFEHRFTLSCRTAFTDHSDVIVYVQTIQTSTAPRLSVEEMDTIWAESKERLLQNPEFVWDVPKDVFLSEYNVSVMHHTY